MKKNKFAEFFKGKGYYVLLFVGVIAIAAVALIGSQLSTNSDGEGQNYVDLNDTDSDMAADDKGMKSADNQPISDGITNNTDSSDETAANEDAAKDVTSNDVEYEDYSENAKNTTQQDKKDADQVKPNAVETSGNTVSPDNTASIGALSFQSGDEMMWPVNGNVIMNYSMDHTIYFSTLMKYKCNPAIIIDAEAGEEVKAAADGIVTAINENDEETGYTLTMSIGNGFSVIYGQLSKDSSSLKVGDSVKEGDVIGVVAEPTKYYSVEGCNLYFAVLENDQTVNPMLYLR